MKTSSIRRKRQVQGRRHTFRVDVYLSRTEKETLQKAAQQAEMSVSQFAVIAIRNAVSANKKTAIADFDPIEIEGEPLSETILRERR